jgi:hypothetical protein
MGQLLHSTCAAPHRVGVHRVRRPRHVVALLPLEKVVRRRHGLVYVVLLNLPGLARHAERAPALVLEDELHHRVDGRAVGVAALHLFGRKEKYESRALSTNRVEEGSCQLPGG